MNVIETCPRFQERGAFVFHREQDSGRHSRPVGLRDNEGHCGHFIHVGH